MSNPPRHRKDVEVLSNDKGPNGRGLCRWCRTEVPKGRLTFCSQACVEEHLVRNNPGHVRRRLRARDEETCGNCGLDCRELLDKLQRLPRAESQLLKQQLVADGWPKSVLSHRDMSLWDADHIVPVAEGGGQCGLDGYRTLCLRCHREASAALARRLAGSASPAHPNLLDAMEAN